MIPVGANYIRAFGSREDAKTRPYYGASLNLVPAKIRSLPDGVNTGIKLGYGGSAFVGTTLGRKTFVEARYRAISDIAGFNLSGLGLSAGIRF